MFFALDYLRKIEKKYPGVFVQLSRSEDFDACWKIITKRKVSTKYQIIMPALNYWNKYKIFYKFDKSISDELFEQAHNAGGYIPEASVKQLPYPCFAAQISPFSISSTATSDFLFTGNVIIWSDQQKLQFVFEEDRVGNETFFCWASLDLNDMPRYDTLLDCVVMEILISSGFSLEELSAIKAIFKLNSFYEMNPELFWNCEDLLDRNFSPDKITTFKDSFITGIRKERLIRIAVQVVLYLNREDSDVEAVKEKLHRGDWASVLGDEHHVANKDEIDKALRSMNDINAFDVGYRVAAKFQHSHSHSDNELDDAKTESSYTLGYGRRRAHMHSYWVGPRAGKPAADPENPQPGEKVRIVKWLEATEIHPELRNDLAIEIPVGQKNTRE